MERYSYLEDATQKCDTCDLPAHRIISPVRSYLEGVSGDFPTASDRWAKTHEQAARVARERKQRHSAPDA